MSKLSLIEFEDKDMVPSTISGLTEAFRTATGQFPIALLVTEEQAKKFFFANNEIVSNFKGIPLEVETKADERGTILKTIDGIMAGMHINRAQSVADVYSQLENMKVKLGGKRDV